MPKKDMPNKSERRQTLENAGLWSDFVVYREKLRGKGLEDKDALREAWQHFAGMMEGEEADHAAGTAKQFEEAANPNNNYMSGGCKSVTRQDKDDEIYRRLAAGCEDTGTQMEMVLWAVRNAFIPPADLKPDDIPDPAALYFHKIVRSPASSSRFLDVLTRITAPTKRDQESQERFVDDGRKTLHVIAEIRDDRHSDDADTEGG